MPVSAKTEFNKAGTSISSSPLNGQLVNGRASYAVGKTTVGLKNTPLQAKVTVGEVGGQAGVGWKHTGASVGASVAEARAGPFEARLGVKFGVGMKNGVPEIDLGLFSFKFYMWLNKHFLLRNLISDSFSQNF